MALAQNPKVRSKNPVQNLAEGTDQPFLTNPRGELLISQAVPAGSESVRLAQGWYVVQFTAVAPVAALPATTAQLALYNGEPQTGKIYVIDSVFGSVVVSAGAAVNNMGLAVQVTSPSQGAITIPTAAASVTPRGLSGRTYQGNAIVGVGSTVPAGPWMPWGTSIIGSAATADAVQAIDIPVEGKIVILPGGILGLSFLASVVATITTVVGVRWHEVLLPYV